jgi:hypothetical protein
MALTKDLAKDLADNPFTHRQRTTGVHLSFAGEQRFVRFLTLITHHIILLFLGALELQSS